jgi:outer membrane receptor protein involved in Fe transport
VAHPLAISAYAESFPEFQGATVVYQAAPNNVSDFFIPQLGTSTSALVRKTVEGASFSFNTSYTDQEGFIETSNLKRLNLSFGGDIQLSNKFSLSAKAEYINTDSNRPTLNVFQLLTWIPRNLDIQNLPYEDPNTGASVYYRTTITNPIWNIKNSGFRADSDRFIGSSNLRFAINDKTSLSYTYGLDLYNELNINHINRGGTITPLGIMQVFNNYNRVTNHRLIYSFNDIKLTEDISAQGQLGFESKNTIRNVSGVAGTDQVVFGFVDLDNWRTYTPITNDVTLDGTIVTSSEQNRLGVFGGVDFSYKDYLYLNFQARNDWGSTVERENQSIFYPSVALSFIPSSAFEGLAGNYLKFRGSYGTSASFPLPYLTRPTLGSQSNAWINPFDGSVVAINAVNSFLPNPDLTPEFLEEWEIGTEGRFFDNRVSFDISLYQKTIEDQILFSNLPNSTGFTRTAINAGDVETEGIEVGLTVTPIRNDNWLWGI